MACRSRLGEKVGLKHPTGQDVVFHRLERGGPGSMADFESVREVGEMRSQSLYLVILLSAAALVVFIAATEHRSPVAAAAADARSANDAAYRDGLYQAQLDVTQKRQAHITSGRWGSEQDRAAFVAGYLQAYHDQMAHGAKLAPSDVAELTGYSEGMADGVRDRKASQPFQAGKSEKSRETELVDGQIAGVYRQAYTNGYQQGFYTLDSDAIGVVGQTTKF